MQNLMSAGRLSIPELRSLATQVSAEELRCIDAQQLPLCIPTELIEEVSQDKQEVIEDFILEVSMHGIEKLNHMEEIFGPEIHQVLTAASAMHASYAHRVFSERVRKMLGIYKNIKVRFDLSLINQFYRVQKSSFDLLKDLKMELAYVQSLFDFTLEQKPVVDPAYAEMLDLPAKELQTRLSNIQALISTYTQVCLCVMGKHMHYIHQRVKTNEENRSTIMQRAERERVVLEDLHSNMITRYTKGPAIQALKCDIGQLMDKAHTYETIISEEQIFGWLDVYVEALLDSPDIGNTQKHLRQTRITLFNLLTQYCNHQEDGAFHAAHNPFTQVDTKKLISFMLRSEKFVLNYFDKKKNEISLWLGDAAHTRLLRLGQVERSILKELRKSRKLS